MYMYERFSYYFPFSYHPCPPHPVNPTATDHAFVFQPIYFSRTSDAMHRSFVWVAVSHTYNMKLVIRINVRSKLESPIGGEWFPPRI